MKAKLEKANFAALTCDGWTSRGRSFVTITAHFLDEEGVLLSKMLSCQSFHVRETGENLLARIESVLMDHKIVQEKLVAAVRDSGSNIVKALKIMGRKGKHINL